MAVSISDKFSVETLPIIGSYNKQRFTQWSPEDTANFYIVNAEETKKPFAMYPVMGRSHIKYLGVNKLVYGSQPRGIFKSINYAYIVVGDTIYRVDENFNQIALTGLETSAGSVYFTFLVVNATVYACFVDSSFIYIYQEGSPGLQKVTDTNAPGISPNTKPGYITTFGNRIVVSVDNSSQFILSAINLQGTGANPLPGYTFDPNKCFTNANTPQVFAQEDGIIRQMGVLNNTLYIFTDYITGIWSNITAVFSGTGTTFPFKKNTTYNWNFGIANSNSLDIDFGIMVFLARNSDGLLEFRYSNGGQPDKMSTKAIDTLLQKYTNQYGSNNPFLVENSNGFLYQYENTIFYRMAGGTYGDDDLLDEVPSGVSIEYSFESKDWHRCIEQNGERNRIQNHVYFNFMHLVTILNESTVYNMSGQFYYNEVRNPDQPNSQSIDAYLQKPFRYERVTPIIYLPDYSEFQTDYVQIDFVFGESNINYLDAPKYLKPSIELFYSDDGGISFNSADVREFSQIGVYSWRMRWYELGASRNRVYKLICVSNVPIVILGGVMNVKKISGGAN